MKPTLGVFGFGQFMEFFTPHLLPYFDIQVYDRSGKNATKIQSNGAKTASWENVAGSDFVLLGYPASYIETLVIDVAPCIKKDAVVFDICSVKTPPTEAMMQHLPEHCHIIGTHPIFGNQSGKDGIKDLKMTFSNIRCDQQRFEDFQNLFGEELQLETIEISAEEHDKHMAYIQGITHFIGRTLKRMNIPDSPLATQSYLHLCETKEMVGNDSDDLFLSIQQDNPFVEDIRMDLLSRFQETEKWIDTYKND